MTDRRASLAPPILGTSVLGGAACGLSYDGALRDAVAPEEQSRRREAGRSRKVAAPQTQAHPPEPGSPEGAPGRYPSTSYR